MAIRYEVVDRTLRPFARWGPALPTPPVRSPVYLPDGGQGLAETFMGETASGEWIGAGQLSLNVRKTMYRMSKPIPPTCAGVWTGGVSDCMVVGAAYYQAGSWPAFWLQHVEGGQYEGILNTIRSGINSGACPDQGGRYGFIAAGNSSGTGRIADSLASAGILHNNITIYVSGTGNRGFAFGINFAVGLFGELVGTGAELPDNWQW